jgi:hypothetical protein
MDILDHIVEQRIAEAAERGDFDQLPGAGKPLELDNDPMIPRDLRIAYRVLRNAGYVPDEIRLLGELASAEQLLARAIDPTDRAVASARMRLLLDRLGASRSGALHLQSQYFDKLLERLTADSVRANGS